MKGSYIFSLAMLAIALIVISVLEENPVGIQLYRMKGMTHYNAAYTNTPGEENSLRFLFSGDGVIQWDVALPETHVVPEGSYIKLALNAATEGKTSLCVSLLKDGEVVMNSELKKIINSEDSFYVETFRLPETKGEFNQIRFSFSGSGKEEIFAIQHIILVFEDSKTGLPKTVIS